MNHRQIYRLNKLWEAFERRWLSGDSEQPQTCSDCSCSQVMAALEARIVELEARPVPRGRPRKAKSDG